MKKNDLPTEDFAALASAVAELPFVQPNRTQTDYMLDVMETVINFHIRVEVVVSSLTYFKDEVQCQHGIATHNDLKAVLARFPDDEEGNKTASQFLWGNFLWTRVALLRRLLAFFESVGVMDQGSLHAWAAAATYERDFRNKVKGLGIAVFHWLQIRCNVDSVKPDVHVLNFGQRVIGRRVSEKKLVEAISHIAPLVGQSMAAVDVTIWFWGRLGMAEHDLPGLRLIAWRMLRACVEVKLREGILGDCNWELILDEQHLLRYDEAGLTLRLDRSLFGDTVQGATIARLYQSRWVDGLSLAMRVEHDTSLPVTEFQRLEQSLVEEGWQVVNHPRFTANLDLEDSMMMSQSLNSVELAEWVAEVVDRALMQFALAEGDEGG